MSCEVRRRMLIFSVLSTSALLNYSNNNNLSVRQRTVFNIYIPIIFSQRPLTPLYILISSWNDINNLQFLSSLMWFIDWYNFNFICSFIKYFFYQNSFYNFLNLLLVMNFPPWFFVFWDIDIEQCWQFLCLGFLDVDFFFLFLKKILVWSKV